MSTPTRKCRYCKGPVVGRKGKIFCSIECKSIYHYRLRAATFDTATPIDKILHRNRSILLEIMGKNKSQKKVDKIELDRKKFNYSYFTHSYTNSKGKVYFYLYDFAWMAFSDQEVLVIRKRFPAKDKPAFPTP